MFDSLITSVEDTDTTVQSVFKQPLFVSFVLGNYLYFVLRCGPKFMRNRQPFELRSLMLVYNVAQVLGNAWLCLFAINAIYSQTGSLVRCIVPDELTKLCHYYYIYNKYFDLLDTIIFVLRKKYNQITFLHVYHHCAVIVFPTLTTHFISGGLVSSIVVLNCFVHTIMYAYYYCMIYSEETRIKFLDWKQNITQVQLVQFVLIVSQFLRSAVGICEYPTPLSLMIVATNGFFLYMFTMFYIKTYLRKKPSSAKN